MLSNSPEVTQKLQRSWLTVAVLFGLLGIGSAYADSITESDWIIVAAAFGLLSFGSAYAHLVNHVERTGFIENRSSYFVAFGVFMTLVFRQMLPPGFVYDLAAFAFSGLPMMANQAITKQQLTADWFRRLKGEAQWQKDADKSGPPTGKR